MCPSRMIPLTFHGLIMPGFTDPFRLFESLWRPAPYHVGPILPRPVATGPPPSCTRQRGRGFFDDPLVGVGFPFDRSNVFDDVMNPGGGNGRSRVYSQVSRGSHVA
jgi:hypothetical protein